MTAIQKLQTLWVLALRQLASKLNESLKTAGWTSLTHLHAHDQQLTQHRRTPPCKTRKITSRQRMADVLTIIKEVRQAPAAVNHPRTLIRERGG